MLASFIRDFSEINYERSTTVKTNDITIRRHMVVCWIVAFLILAITAKITGRIPISNGAGWDGAVYLKYAQNLAMGEIGEASPYHLSRLLSFTPVIIAAFFGYRDTDLLTFQIVFNSVQLATALVIFLRLMLDRGLSKIAAWSATSCLGLSWPWLVMPAFYPMLSDYTAMVVSVISMWYWHKSRPLALALLAFLSVWIMPGLFLVPLILACIPTHFKEGTMAEKCIQSRWVDWATAFVTCIIVLPVFLILVFPIKDQDIAAHPAGFDSAWLSLKWISMVSLLLSVAAVSYGWTKLLLSSRLWLGISPISAILSISLVAASHFLLVSIPNWGTGFRGPPLLDFMLLQSLAAPFKPIVAHLLYFGPIVPITLVTLSVWSFSKNMVIHESDFALKVVMLAFLPFLLIGSESRQWVAIFPVMVAWFSTKLHSERKIMSFALLGMMSLIPAPLLRTELMQPDLSLFPFTHLNWQIYFGRHGPWMSREYYFVGIILLLACLQTYRIINNAFPKEV